MADSSAKRIREARKRQHREMKTERKRLRKDGLLGHDISGLFHPGEKAREVVDPNPPPPPQPPPPPPTVPDPPKP